MLKGADPCYLTSLQRVANGDFNLTRHYVERGFSLQVSAEFHSIAILLCIAASE